MKPFITYAIYDHPKDYPDHFVVRKWIGEIPEEFLHCKVDTLSEAQASIPKGYTKVLPHKDDDPVIIETWI